MRIGDGRVGIEKAGMARLRCVDCNERRIGTVTSPCTVLTCAT